MLLLILFTMMHDVTTSNAPKLSTSLYVLHQYHPHKAGACGTLSGINYTSVEISIILFCSFIMLRNNLHLACDRYSIGIRQPKKRRLKVFIFLYLLWQTYFGGADIEITFRSIINMNIRQYRHTDQAAFAASSSFSS